MSEHSKLPWGTDVTRTLIFSGKKIIADTMSVSDNKERAQANANFIVLACNSRAALVEACEDPFSYEHGDNPTFADALLNLGDNLGKLDETMIAVWRLFLLAKAEELQAALAAARGE